MKPRQLLFLLFLCVPILEIYFLIQVGGHIGGLNTVLLVLLTAVFGAYLVRTQGLATAERVRLSLAQGRLPAMEILEGLVILVAGVLLLTPGFFTDILGLLSLIPLLRRILLITVIKNSVSSVRHKTPESNAASSRIIEGECRRED